MARVILYHTATSVAANAILASGFVGSSGSFLRGPATSIRADVGVDLAASFEIVG